MIHRSIGNRSNEGFCAVLSCPVEVCQKDGLRHFWPPWPVQETTRIPAHLRRESPKLPWVCDLGLQEAQSDFLPLDQMMQQCLHHGVSVIHTGRVGAVAKFLNMSAKLNQSSQKESSELSRGKPSMTIISQRSSEDSIHFWSSSGQLDNGSVWTRCAGKLATALLVQRLVELRLLPGLDEPIVEFLQLSGKWFPTWKQHPVMKNLTLRHVMAGVGGGFSWKISCWCLAWLTQYQQDHCFFFKYVVKVPNQRPSLYSLPYFTTDFRVESRWPPWWAWRSPAAAGLPKWRWLPDWVTQAVRPVLELAERSLSFVNSSFLPGAWTCVWLIKSGTIASGEFERSTWAQTLGVLDVPGLILGKLFLVTRKRLIRCLLDFFPMEWC